MIYLGLLTLIALGVVVFFPRTRHYEWTGADLIQAMRARGGGHSGTGFGPPPPPPKAPSLIPPVKP